MKKTFTLLVATVVILFSACTKNSQLPELSDSYWKFNGIAHFVTSSQRTEASGGSLAQVVFTDKNKDRNGTLTVFFKALPRVNASYNIVAGSAGILADNQCAISTSDSSGQGFTFSGATAAVQVTFTGGKIKIDIPAISMSTAGGTENYSLAGSVYEHD